MKKLISLLLIMSLLLTQAVCASAQESQPETKEETTAVEEVPQQSPSEEVFEDSTSGETPTEDEIEEESSSDTRPSITMAINNQIMIANGIQIQMAPPLLVLGKTYVELQAVAAQLGIGVEWVPDTVGFFRLHINGAYADFTLISTWDNLTDQKHKFFVKDKKIYASLRELADLAQYDITYTNGLITVGGNKNTPGEIYGDISTKNSNDYVYSAYPHWAQYTVNPYQQYSYENMMNDAAKLRLMYPDIVQLSSIGKSVEDRDLLLIEFGRGAKKIFVCATHHAREYISTTYVMYAIDRYAYAYKNKSMWGSYNPREILDNVTFCIVPMVNPDGVNLVQNGPDATKHAEELSKMKIYEGSKYGYKAWKANINGVDVNWNYDKDWDEEKNKNPRGSSGFNGHSPNTEPETRAVSQYVDSIPFDAFLSVHTQGRIFYWADTVSPSSIYNAIKNDTGFTGYEEKATGVGGSFFDYVFRKYKKPTVTLELCHYIGNYPYPDSDFNTVWSPAKNVLLVLGKEIIK